MYLTLRASCNIENQVPRNQIMIFPTWIYTLAFGFFVPLASTSPIDLQALAPAASAHNIYLLTCSQYGGRGSNVTGIAFFNAPITNIPGGGSNWNNSPQPDESAIISNPATAWEGYKLQIAVWNSTIFSADISTGARELQKGKFVGEASLGTEKFACFRDGETGIAIGGGNGNGWGPGGNPGGWGPGGPGGWGPGRRPPTSSEQQDSAAGVSCTADYWCGSLG